MPRTSFKDTTQHGDGHIDDVNHLNSNVWHCLCNGHHLKRRGYRAATKLA